MKRWWQYDPKEVDIFKLIDLIMEEAQLECGERKYPTKGYFRSLCDCVWDNDNHWLIGRHRGMSYVNRFVVCNTAQPYTVADHTANMAVLFSIFIEKYNERTDEDSCMINSKLAMDIYKEISIHDVFETITTDIPHFMKRRFRDVVIREEQANFEYLNLPSSLYDCSPTVHKYVKVLDFIEMLLYLYEHYKLGMPVIKKDNMDEQGRPQNSDIIYVVMEKLSLYAKTLYEEQTEFSEFMSFEADKLIAFIVRDLKCLKNTNQCAESEVSACQQ